ncbi:hypothetical protein H0H87_004209 [Tephrocybe sp. NHM501043]|nr:hypothetical protein H0H87_004209 [Tephrocybe sp. NHM501043]
MKRKMKAEDEEVDIDTIVEDTTPPNALLDGMDTEDEDFAMKIIMQEDNDE